MWTLKNNTNEYIYIYICMYVYKKQKQTYRYRRQASGYQRGEENGEGQIRGMELTDKNYYE